MREGRGCSLVMGLVLPGLATWNIRGRQRTPGGDRLRPHVGIALSTYCVGAGERMSGKAQWCGGVSWCDGALLQVVTHVLRLPLLDERFPGAVVHTYRFSSGDQVCRGQALGGSLSGAGGMEGWAGGWVGNLLQSRQRCAGQRTQGRSMNADAAEHVWNKARKGSGKGHSLAQVLFG